MLLVASIAFLFCVSFYEVLCDVAAKRLCVCVYVCVCVCVCTCVCVHMIMSRCACVVQWSMIVMVWECLSLLRGTIFIDKVWITDHPMRLKLGGVRLSKVTSLFFFFFFTMRHFTVFVSHLLVSSYLSISNSIPTQTFLLRWGRGERGGQLLKLFVWGWHSLQLLTLSYWVTNEVAFSSGQLSMWWLCIHPLSYAVSMCVPLN